MPDCTATDFDVTPKPLIPAVYFSLGPDDELDGDLDEDWDDDELDEDPDDDLDDEEIEDWDEDEVE